MRKKLLRVAWYHAKMDTNLEHSEKRYFSYGDEEISHLKTCDARFAEVIEIIGPIKREIHPDLFSALINSIIGQQISTKAQATIWRRMVDALGEITPETITACSEDTLQGFGTSFRKVGYLKNVADLVLSGQLDIEGLHAKSDEEVCRELSAIHGIGVWTAEMLMTFSMQRKNIFSYGDLAIHRGLRMVYHHRKISKELFEKYRRRYSPYASVASLYLWAVAGGAIDGMKDYAPKVNKKNKHPKKPKDDRNHA